MQNDDLLNFAFDNDILNPSVIQQQYDMSKYLSQHTHSIWQGKNGRWMTYLPDGKGGRKLLSKKTREDVEKEVIKYWKNEEENPTIKEIYDTWNQRRLSNKDIGMATFSRQQTDFNRFFGEFGHRRVRYVRPIDIEDFVKQTVADLELTTRAYGRMKSILKGVFQRAYKEGYIDYRIKEVLEDIEFSKNTFKVIRKEDSEKVYTQEEEDILMEYFYENPSLVNLGIAFLFKSGLRIGELSTLTPQDITPDGVLINKTETSYMKDGKKVSEVKYQPKTQAGIREVLLTKEAKDILKRIRLLNPFGEYLFMKNGKRMKNAVFQRHMTVVCKNLGIPYRSLHKVRATYGTKLYDSGMPKAIICKQMGHTDISCLEKNYYFDRNGKNEKIKMLEAVEGL